MTKDQYLAMCEQLGSEPIDSEIPLEYSDLPHEAQQAHEVFHYLPDRLDGFSGTGMTGVASKLCGDVSFIRELGFNVDNEGYISQANNEKISKIGLRNPILNDLSPIASSSLLPHTLTTNSAFESIN